MEALGNRGCLDHSVNPLLGLSLSFLICKTVIMSRTYSGSQKPPNICEVCGILRGLCQCLQVGLVESR